MRRPNNSWIALVLAVAWTAAAGPAAADDTSKLRLSGDFRFRLEADWESQRADGTPRADRDRARIRGRLGLTARISQRLTAGLRLRTGSRDSQQSPHVTIEDFDGNPTGDRDVLPDQWYLKIRGDRGWAWAGRNGFPFWKQNELFWDDDVTLAGLAFGGRRRFPEAGRGELSWTGGYFALPDGGTDFHGEMAAAQLLFATRHGDVDFKLAGGVFRLRGKAGAERLRNGNGARDYTLWVVSFQTVRPVGRRPLTLGIDLLYNSQGYSAADPDPFTAANHDQTGGGVASIRWGAVRERGDWLVGYTYANVETLAVNASYAQDDWVRWGSATQTDSSDFQGHELRFVYGLGPGMDLTVRLYVGEAITSVQDGKRLRLDYNVKF